MRQFAKIPSLLVTDLCLELCELSSFLIGEERKQGFQLGCRLLGLVGPLEHYVFKFPERLIVIHISSFAKALGETIPAWERCGWRGFCADRPTEASAIREIRPEVGPANQLDDGIGDTLVSRSMFSSADYNLRVCLAALTGTGKIVFLGTNRR